MSIVLLNVTVVQCEQRVLREKKIEPYNVIIDLKNTKRRRERGSALKRRLNIESNEIRARSSVWSNEEQYGLRTVRHFGLAKVFIDLAFFAIAFNIKKLCKILEKRRLTFFYPLLYAYFFSFSFLYGDTIAEDYKKSQLKKMFFAFKIRL